VKTSIRKKWIPDHIAPRAVRNDDSNPERKRVILEVHPVILEVHSTHIQNPL